MPRKRNKTQGAKVPTGMPYGQGQVIADAQRQMPLPGPGSRPQAGMPGRAPAPPSAPAQEPPAPQDPMAAALAAAQRTAPPTGGLFGPSRRPDEPVTAGLPIGPGAGPRALPIPVFDAEDDALLDLLNAYKVSPSPSLLRYIEIARNRASTQAAYRSEAHSAQRGY